ncbi:isochorismatase family protein [Microlunatus speluncae]|uniref:isochorismatase family protein n=1 Tax=Microlunatus speluncae TaxID=2594267 RepID=UPI00126637D0|nr:isochorismatase family protein [Microlunatus speluncae]
MIIEPVDSLLVVDLQRGFTTGPEALPDAAQVLDRVRRLLDAARRTGALVVHLQNDGPAGEVDEPGTPGWELMLAEPGEPVIRKTEDDGFSEPKLGELLARHGAHRVAVCGLLSEMCVSATVRGALSRDLEVVLPRDAHATYDLEEIPAAVVSRVAEHALGDAPEFPLAGEVTFATSPADRATL